MSQAENLINGELLRLRREAQGWVVTDMATRACLSPKQVRQLEEGGTSAFYSESVKVTAAKKVGALLGLSVDEVFISSVTTPVQQEAHTEESPVIEQTPIDTQPESATAELQAPTGVPAQTPVASESPVHEEAKPKTSIWVIVGLFAAALGVAAYMQPKEEAPAEAAPPLQVVPSEADAAASAAESAASSASAAAESAASSAVQKPATATAAAASAAPVSAPAASAASKAP